MIAFTMLGGTNRFVPCSTAAKSVLHSSCTTTQGIGNSINQGHNIWVLQLLQGCSFPLHRQGPALLMVLHIQLFDCILRLCMASVFCQQNLSEGARGPVL